MLLLTSRPKGAITSKIKHAIKLTSPARLEQLLQPSLYAANVTTHRTVRRHWLHAKTNANEGCNSCASLAGLVLSFIACFILLVIAPSLVYIVMRCVTHLRYEVMNTWIVRCKS